MRKQTCWLFTALVLSVAAAITAQGISAQEYTSRMEVLQNEALRRDFTIQGVYLAGTGTDKAGLHMIANGDGTFRVVFYHGGLPGDGWKAGDRRVLGTAKVDGDKITFNITDVHGTSPEGMENPRGETEGKITIETPQRGQGQGAGQFRGTPVKIEVMNATYERQTTRSPTFNQAAPDGAVVIFDGTNLDKFQPGAKMNEAPQRPGAGSVQQRPGAGNTLWAEAATTAFEKKPYKMHIEFMLSYMPQAREQGRSNSGVYVDERYELQVLDSFGLEGENNECGGFYTVAKPLVNMCFPPLTWQTYDIEFTPAQYDGNQKTVNARVTVVHNGVKIHDNIELQGTPGRKDEGPEPLGLYLQGHGNKVQYRNIWLQYQDAPAVQAVVETPELTAAAERPRRRSGITIQQPSNPDVPQVVTVVVAPDAQSTTEESGDVSQQQTAPRRLLQRLRPSIR